MTYLAWAPASRLGKHACVMRLLHRSLVVALLVVSTMTSVEQASAQRALLFSCTTFPSDLSEMDLRSLFGDSHVATGLVPWGGAEGEYNEGTILFGETPNTKVEILWRDREAKRLPEWVSVRGMTSRWRTTGGITLGTDLLTIERLNRRPFRLIGMDNDVQGTVMSWAGGQLEAQNSKDCRVRVRLRDESGPAGQGPVNLRRQVAGDREFSSSHPAMQAINPKVYELFIAYTGQ